MAPKSKRFRFIDDEAEVDNNEEEEEEEEEENNGLGGFLTPEEPALDASHRPPGPASDSDGVDMEEIAAYVESLKRRVRDFNRVGGSSTHTELWMLPVPPGMEKTLTKSLMEISSSEIMIHHVPYLPRRIYIEAPSIAEIQEFMKFSTYSHLVSRATRILDDINRSFLHDVPDIPSQASWVRIIQAGIYKGDLAVVLSTPSMGDVVSIAVVPRFEISHNKKRKGVSAPQLLDEEILAKVPPNKKYIHSIGSRRFHRCGLELLEAPSAHALKNEPRPSLDGVFLFQSCFERTGVTGNIESIIRRAVNRALRHESRRFWRAGDRVRILEGPFVDTSCSIHEIDEANQFTVVVFGSLKSTFVQVSMKDLERHFLVGDQVRVAFGRNKGRTGSIIEITDDVGTIVEGTANQLIEFEALLLYLESCTEGPSFVATPHPAASSMSNPKPPHEYKAVKSYQMLGGRDPRIGREAAVYVGQMKGYQGRLLEIGRTTGKIECPGRQQHPTYTALLAHLVLLDTPTHNLAGTRLIKPYVGRNLMRPEPSLPRTSTPPPLPDEVPEMTLEERGEAPIELGSGAFLRDPQTCANLEGFHVKVGFHGTYQNGGYVLRHGHTPLPDRFTDAEGQCPHHEVCIIVTDHRTALPVPRRVELRHLKPVPPKKKGDWIVIISGDRQGVVAEVDKCKTKALKAEVVINGEKIAFDFSDICRLTKPD